MPLRRHAFLAMLLVACGESYGVDPTNDGGASQGAGGTIEFPESVNVDALRCGETKSATITLTNPTGVEAPYEVRIAENDTFTLRDVPGGAATGILKPRDAIFVYVDAKGAKPGTSSADVIVKSGTRVGQVKATVEVKGSRLVAGTSLLDFGEVRKDTKSAPVDLPLVNDGNEPVLVTGFDGLTQDFAFTNSTLTIPPGGAKLPVMMTAGPASANVTAATITPIAAGLCGASPAITLRGKRVNSDVTVSPATIDFGDQPCNATPSPKPEITITNYGVASSVTWTTKLTAVSSRFTIASGATGTVPSANGATPATAKIVLAGKSVGLPLGEVNEDLEITTTSPGEGMRTQTVKLHLKAYGAILEINPPSLGSFAVNETKSFSVKNVGNATVCLNYSFSGSGFSVEPDDIVPANGVEDIRAQFIAVVAGTYSGAITVTAQPNCPFGPAPLCSAPLKPSVSATRP